MIGNVLLGIVSLCTIISYVPQIIKLLKTKESDDISSSSWMLWVISSLAFTLYTLIINKDLMLIFKALLELMFCSVILLLSLIYKSK